MDYGYSQYRGPELSLVEQIAKVRKDFPNAHSVNEQMYHNICSGKLSLAKGAEGWFAVPNWRKLPQFSGCYTNAVRCAFTLLESTKIGFKNYIPNEFYDSDLFMEREAKKQNNPDVLILAAQTGMNYAGRRASDVLAEIESYGEYSLDPFTCAVILYLCPNRLNYFKDLGMVCSYINKKKEESSGIFIHWDEKWGHLGRTVCYGPIFPGIIYEHCGLSTGFFL